MITFDGTKATTYPFEAVNDPVMGGQSISTVQVDADKQVLLWVGEVKIVPFLGAAGFCNAQSPGLYKTADFVDVSGYDGVSIHARTNGTGLTSFNVMIMTKGAHRLQKQGVYSANFTFDGSSDFED